MLHTRSDRPWGTLIEYRDSFLGAKRRGHETYSPNPARRLGMSGAISLLPLHAFMTLYKETFTAGKCGSHGLHKYAPPKKKVSILILNAVVKTQMTLRHIQLLTPTTSLVSSHTSINLKTVRPLPLFRTLEHFPLPELYTCM
jgi:hypothetical protein